MRFLLRFSLLFRNLQEGLRNKTEIKLDKGVRKFSIGVFRLTRYQLANQKTAIEQKFNTIMISL